MCFDVGGSSGAGADSGSSNDSGSSKTTKPRTKADVQKEINKKIKAATDSSGNVDWKKADVGALVKERESFSDSKASTSTKSKGRNIDADLGIGGKNVKVKDAGTSKARVIVTPPKDDKPAKKTTVKKPSAGKKTTEAARARRAKALAAKKKKIKEGTVAEGKGTGDYKTIGDVLEDPIGFYKDTRRKIIDGATADLTMGLKTLGLNKEKQAEKLRELGYSEKAIISFQERTEATKERMERESALGSDDDSGVVKTSTTKKKKKKKKGGGDESSGGSGTEREEDIGGAGDTSVTAEDIMTEDPDDALSAQERLAARELKRQRQLRALSKAQRLRTRIESAGGGRRSLMRGSLGGAGFRSGY